MLPHESEQSTLGKGDFTRIAATMRESGEASAVILAERGAKRCGQNSI
jgi:hypothetical protein